MNNAEIILSLLKQDQSGVISQDWHECKPTIVKDSDILEIQLGNEQCAIVFDKTGNKFLGVINWRD